MLQSIRRKIAWRLVLLMCLIIYFPNGTAFAEGTAYQMMNGESIRCLCGSGDKAYVLTSQRVVEITTADGTANQREVTGNPWNTSFLFATPDGFVGITAQNACYLYDGNTWNQVDLAPGDPTLMDPNLIVFSAAALGDDIYESVYDPVMGSNRCFLLRPKAGTLQEIPDMYPMDVAAYRQGQLLFTANDENGNALLYVYDTGTGISSQITLENAPGNFRALAYEEEDDTLYVITPDGIAGSKSGGAFQTILPLKNANGLASLNKNSIAVWSGDSVYACGTNAEFYNQALTVMNVSSRFDTAFTASTGIALASFNTPDMSVMEHMSFALASRDGTVDIYGFLTRDGLKTIKEKGMFTTLSQSAVLTKSAQSLYPVLNDAICYEGQIVAWPIVIQPILHDEEKGILAQYGLSSPETFDELMDILPKLVEENILAENGLRVFDTIACTKEGLLKYFIDQYLFAQQKDGKQISFDTELFRHIAGRILAEAPDVDPALSDTGEESPLFVLGSVAGRISEDLLPPFRLSEEDAAIETMVGVAVVNPFSPHREEAIRYLEFISAQRDEESYVFFADMQEPWPSRYAQDELYHLSQALERE